MIFSIFILLSIFVLIQSIYGVGLLIFGTPVLLMLGMEYDVVLGLLLPSSIFISIQQVILNKKAPIDKKIIPLVLFGILLGLTLSLQTTAPNALTTIMGCSMLVITTFRMSAKIREKTASILIRNQHIFHFLNAIFHGFSNLGGVFLSVYSTVIHKDKKDVLHCTAFFYLIYALGQMTTIILIARGSVFFHGLSYLPCTVILYFFVGRKSFKLITQSNFDRITTFFFLSVGVVFLLRSPIFN